jgi:anaerobic selenocysteine-containing dehydrogenase
MIVLFIWQVHIPKTAEIRKLEGEIAQQQAKIRENNAKIIVADPRRTQWDKWADRWLRPLPGTDIAWINGLIRLLIEKGATSKTEGFETMRSSLGKFSPEFVNIQAFNSSKSITILKAVTESSPCRQIESG